VETEPSDSDRSARRAMLAPHSFPHWQLWSVNILLLIPRASSIASNRTIDDTLGDSATGVLPIYSRNWSKGQNCPSCLARPDQSATFDHSWHDTTSDSPPGNPAHNVSISFQGTAIWVYCVVPNHIQDASTLVNISFTLDGSRVGTYMHQPNQSDVYEYNVTVYSNVTMENSEHTLVMTAQDDPNPSIILFDWAKYTFEDEAPPGSSQVQFTATTSSSITDIYTWPGAATETVAWSSAGDTTIAPQASPSIASQSHSNTSAVIGSVIGSLCGLVIVILLLLCVRRRQLSPGRLSLTIRDSLDGKGEEAVIEPFMVFRQTNEAPRTPAPERLPMKGRLATAAASWRWHGASTTHTSEPGPSIEPPTVASSNLTTTSRGISRREALATQIREMKEEIKRLREVALRGAKPAPNASLLPQKS